LTRQAHAQSFSLVHREGDSALSNGLDLLSEPTTPFCAQAFPC
jgi:hypothetical protein